MHGTGGRATFKCQQYPVFFLPQLSQGGIQYPPKIYDSEVEYSIPHSLVEQGAVLGHKLQRRRLLVATLWLGQGARNALTSLQSDGDAFAPRIANTLCPSQKSTVEHAWSSTVGNSFTNAVGSGGQACHCADGLGVRVDDGTNVRPEVYVGHTSE
jgi:hypothetical protein